MILNRYLHLVVISLLFINCQTEKPAPKTTDSIRLNQIGYYPESAKEFVLVDSEARSFQITDELGEVVFSGELQDRGTWDTSGESVMSGNFSTLKTPGTYRIEIDSVGASYTFEIKRKLYEDALNASIKSYYFQRASMPIEEAYGGIYKRAAGHPDTACVYHPSSKHKKGELESPGGWYDAGDYGKYTVNAARTTGQMLHLLEQFPDVIPDSTLNIPESGNEQSDLWD